MPYFPVAAPGAGQRCGISGSALVPKPELGAPHPEGNGGTCEQVHGFALRGFCTHLGLGLALHSTWRQDLLLAISLQSSQGSVSTRKKERKVCKGVGGQGRAAVLGAAGALQAAFAMMSTLMKKTMRKKTHMKKRSITFATFFHSPARR